VATHKQLMLAVWGPDANADAQFVRVLVSQVRQKIEEDPSTPRIILTELGVGYRLVSDDAAEVTAPAANAR
jgi:two-component system KDP operon response regulator KdpE